MRTKKSAEGDKNLQIAYWFGASIVLIVVISFLFRFVSVAFQSKFDGKHRFTVRIESEDKKVVVSIEPLTNSGSVLEISKEVHIDSIGKTLKLPIDGKITFPSSDPRLLRLIDEKEDVAGSELSWIFLSALFRQGPAETDLTSVDLFRLALSSYALSTSSIKKETIAQPVVDYETDKLVNKLFADHAIIQENASVQVINGTQIPGFGNRLARFLSNSGATVIAISTSSQPVTTSRITYIGKKTYTVSRLSQILGFPAYTLDTTSSTSTPIPVLGDPQVIPSPKPQQSISDIIIVIGSQSANSLVF